MILRINKKRLYLKPYTLNPSGGFTLIEIIVSISIFTVVMLVTMGSLLTLNDSSRKAQALRTVIDNLNFAVEDMNRKIRTGDLYHCYATAEEVTSDENALKEPRNCAGEGGRAISLKTQEVEGPDGNRKNVWVAYIFKPGENGGAGVIKQRRSAIGGGPNLELEETAITSPEVDIERMEFRVVGTGANDPKTQPMVILNISGTVNLQKEKLQTDFSLQTAISRRGTE